MNNELPDGVDCGYCPAVMVTIGPWGVCCPHCGSTLGQHRALETPRE